MVVFIHAYILLASPEDSFGYALKTTISKGLCYMANPLFFMISGFFFYRKGEKITASGYFGMLKKKARTLGIPYLLISGMVLAFYGIFKITQFSGVWDILYQWIVNPIPFHLWYLRYLMLLCVISPLIYYVVKKAKYVYLVAILAAWFFLYYKIDWPLISVTFFSVGAFISIHKIEIPYYNNNKVLLSLAVFFWVFLSYLACIILNEHLFIMCLVRNLSIVCGLVAVWWLYDCFYSGIEKLTKSSILNYSFFIYLMHYPLLFFVKRFIMRKVTALSAADYYTPLSGYVSYFLAPLITITICILVGMALKRFVPPVYNIITGNR